MCFQIWWNYGEYERKSISTCSSECIRGGRATLLVVRGAGNLSSTSARSWKKILHITILLRTSKRTMVAWQQKNMERKQRANWWLVHHPPPIPHKTGEITGSPTKGALPSAYLVPPPHPTPPPSASIQKLPDMWWGYWVGVDMSPLFG